MPISTLTIFLVVSALALAFMTRYFDMLKDIGAALRTNAVLIPHSPGSLRALDSGEQSSSLRHRKQCMSLMSFTGGGGAALRTTHGTVPLGELVVAAFDAAAHCSTDPSEVSDLATRAVMRTLSRSRSNGVLARLTVASAALDGPQ